MALHKLWLADKPERNANKRSKDRAQGEMLLDAVHEHMSIAYPLDVEFVMDLPEELQTYFDRWASTRQFIPENTARRSLR